MYGVGSGADCAEMITPRVDNYLYRQTLDVGVVLDNEATAVVSLLAVLLLILGTTFVGHDWNTGSISNQLLFEPRRQRVWAAKGLAISLVGLVAGAVALLVFWSAIGLLVAQRDIAAGAGEWSDVRTTAARGVLLVALAGLLGYALTMLLRSTVATLGICLGLAAPAHWPSSRSSATGRSAGCCPPTRWPCSTTATSSTTGPPRATR